MLESSLERVKRNRFSEYHAESVFGIPVRHEQILGAAPNTMNLTPCEMIKVFASSRT
jgi:hypothetical protein